MTETCHCHNPVFQLLADTLLDEDGIKKTSEAMGVAGDLECQPVSVMYTGGVIRPMKNGAVDQVDAIGFHSGKVVAAGSESEVTTQMDNLGKTYTTIKLSNGQTLLPGLIEPHVHIVATAMTMAWNDFSPFEGQHLRKLYDIDWLKGEIKRIDGTLMVKESWILAQGVDPSLMEFTVVEGGLNELYSLNCDTLDKIIEDRPLMMLSASMHTSYVNTAALCKVYDSNESIREKFPTFDDYRTHVNERGGLQELEEMEPAVHAIPRQQQNETISMLTKNFDSLFETANQRGVTLMYDAGMVSNLKHALEKYLSVERARVRIGYAQLCKTLEDAESIGPYVPPAEEFTNVYQGSVKLISDGSNQGLTGYQNETYRCKPEDNTGLFNFPKYEGFAELVKVVAEKGWPLMIHANGNKAIEYTVAAYKDAVGAATGSTKRHRIEHCSLLNKSKLEEMHSLGISPSFLIGHVGYWGYAFKEAIFEEKADEQLDLCKSALDIGMRITLHSDTSVSPVGPLRLMEQAITRIMEKDPDKRVLNENERITAEQALQAATYDAAWQCHADQWVGSLEEGKLADYVILEKDPIANVENMRDILVQETWVGGMKNYPK